MNYERIYSEFIADRRSKESALTGYTEKHHILPRSLGGTDEPSNLIRLTPADHYFAHECLARAHGGKMWAALYFMSHSDTKSANGVLISRWKYEAARKNYSQNLPEHIRDVGLRLVNSETRIKALAKYHATTDISAIIKSRFKDSVFFERWMESQKEVWTDARREARGRLTAKAWKDPAYVAKMKRGKEKELSELMKKRWQDPVYAEKMKIRTPSVATQFKGKKTINIDTGKIFESSLEAAAFYGVSGNAIRNAIKLNRKSAGYRWAYADEMKAAA